MKQIIAIMKIIVQNLHSHIVEKPHNKTCNQNLCETTELDYIVFLSVRQDRGPYYFDPTLSLFFFCCYFVDWWLVRPLAVLLLCVGSGWPHHIRSYPGVRPPLRPFLPPWNTDTTFLHSDLMSFSHASDLTLRNLHEVAAKFMPSANQPNVCTDRNMQNEGGLGERPHRREFDIHDFCPFTV